MNRQMRPYLATFGTCLLIVLAMWAVTMVFVRQVERSTLGEAAATRHNLARSLAEYEGSSARAIDLALVLLRELWRQNPVRFGESVAAQADLLGKEKVIQVAVLDANGWLVYSRISQGGQINFSDREYFRIHQSGREDALHISAPVLGRVTRQWAIQFSRPIRDSAGRFAGVIVMAVPPPALQEVYKDIELGPAGVVTLIRTDGQILARSVDFENSVNKTLKTWVAVAQEGKTSGDFTARGTLDGVERQFAYRKIEDYGISVLVGQGTAALMASYRKQRNYVFGITAAATLFAFGVASMIALRLRDRARYDSRHEALMLELHDGCIQSIYAVGLRLHAARGKASADPGHVARMIADAEADLNLVIQDLRAFISGGPRAAYSAEEFLAQLQRSIPPTHRAMFEVGIDEALAGSLPAEKSEHVLRIAREAASNVARHAGAQSATITLQRCETGARLQIEDDGAGSHPEPRGHSGLGLAHIEARAKKLGGRANVDSVPGRGTKITVEFPA